MQLKKSANEIANRQNAMNKKIEYFKCEQKENEVAEKLMLERVKGIPNRVKVAKGENLINYITALNANRQKSIQDIIARGKMMQYMSTFCAILSGLTTCLGIIDMSNLLEWIAECILVVIVAVATNLLVKNYEKFRKEFYTKDDMHDKLKFALLNAIIVTYTTFSIITNFQFWTMSHLGTVGSVIFSVLYDALAIECALISEKFLTLDYNDTTLAKILDDKDIKDLGEEESSGDDDYYINDNTIDINVAKKLQAEL